MKAYLKSSLSSKDFKVFMNLVNLLYQSYDNGFYVRAKPFEGNPDGAIKYLLRYFNRPAMAQSRILYYDGSYVVFYYQRHEDDMFVVEKVHVYDLIKRLIIHIPDKNFKMLANWHMRIQLYFHYDPLVCPFCNQTMLFSELVIAKNSS